MTPEFLRMKALLEEVGLRFDEGGITYAEIDAYAEGLSLINNRLNEIVGEIFLTAEPLQAEKYCALLGLNTALIPQEALMSMLIQRFSQGYAASTVSSQRKDYRLISRSNYAAQNNQMLYFVDAIYSFEELKEFGKFLSAYLPAGMAARCSSNGMSFASWDALDKCFYELDSLRLPFSITDTLRSNSI